MKRRPLPFGLQLSGKVTPKERVATGRNLAPEQVELVARGRVWSGARAKEKGLVDSHGGFFDALADARLRAGMNPTAPYNLVILDPYSGALTLPGQLVQLGRMVESALVPQVQLPAEMKEFWRFAVLRHERVFAMLPYSLRIQ